jgi:uncharacterized cofD-like protein
MALAALCGQDTWDVTWSRVLQHRFEGAGDMRGHVVGNLLIVSLWELLGDHVDALDWVGRLLGAKGRVLPMALTPMVITAEVEGLEPDSLVTVRGQVEVASTSGRIASIALEPADPTVCPESVAAVHAADWLVLGPGSWFTSVIPHLMVRDLCEAIVTTDARLIVVLNLEEQAGETDGLGPAGHLAVLLEHAPELRPHVVLADPRSLGDGADELAAAVASQGARLVLEDVMLDDGSARHDPAKLAAAYARIMADD